MDFFAPIDLSQPFDANDSASVSSAFPNVSGSNQSGLNNSEVSFLKGFSNYNDSWLTPAPQPTLGTSFSSPTPNNTGSNASPNLFGDIFSGLGKALGQGAGALIAGGATNLANRIAAQPTLKTPAKSSTTSAGITNTISSIFTVKNVVIFGAIIGAIYYISRK